MPSENYRVAHKSVVGVVTKWQVAWPYLCLGYFVTASQQSVAPAPRNVSRPWTRNSKSKTATIMRLNWPTVNGSCGDKTINVREWKEVGRGEVEDPWDEMRKREIERSACQKLDWVIIRELGQDNQLLTDPTQCCQHTALVQWIPYYVCVTCTVWSAGLSTTLYVICNTLSVIWNLSRLDGGWMESHLILTILKAWCLSKE